MNKKYILSLLILTAAAIGGCKKESFVNNFDKLPQERMADTIQWVKQTLASAPNGWIGLLPTYNGGGYGFYMSFDTAALSVAMVSDFSAADAAGIKQSTFRVRADLGALLSFDSYNYITILNNPDGDDVGTRDGYGGDIDFIYDHVSGDSIVFIGKRYRETFSLVKATAAEQTRYLNGDYSNAVSSFSTFFGSYEGAYFTLEDGTRVDVDINVSNSQVNGKRITLTASTAQDAPSETEKFAFTLDKMAILNGGITLLGNTYVKLAWKDAVTMAIYTSSAKEYIINADWVNVTNTLVVNPGSPFTYSSWDGARWGLLAGWTTTAPMRNANGYGGYEYRSGVGVLSLEAGWGLAAVTNGKIYQQVHLDRPGKWRLATYVSENDGLGAKYLAATAAADFPDIETLSTALGYTNITTAGGGSVQSVEFTVAAPADVLIGFVCNLPGTGSTGTYMKMKYVTLSYSSQ